jgi:hypothetical protein
LRFGIVREQAAPVKPLRLRSLALACALVAAVAAAPASAKIYEPTRKDDPPPNGCKPRNCSLREATIAANETTAKDTILLRGGAPYRVQLPRTITTPLDGDFDLRDNPVTIRGHGRTKTTISGNGIDRALYVSSSDAKLRALTVTGGAAADGGGINSYFSDLTLDRVRVTGNDAANVGAGLYHHHGTMTVKRSTVDDNEAGGGGGALYMLPGLTETKTRIIASTLNGNYASLGAGVYADGFHPNPASFNNKPIVELVNSTVSGNFARVSGGGIASIQGSTVTADNSTITYNIADTDHMGGGSGGGVFQSSGATATLSDSIVAANSHGATGDGANCAGAVGFAHTVLANQPGTACTPSGTFLATDSPLIQGLADNGGPTQTVKLQSGSPAIGYADGCPKRDQRGKRRPADCDSGAFENDPIR